MLPTGTVTFLFTDIEGSTRLWEKYPSVMHAVVANHDAIIRKEIEDFHGYIIKTTGDGFHAVFTTAMDAIHAAVRAQEVLHTSSQDQSQPFALKVRMGLHTGEAEQRDGDYYGSVLNRAARLMSVARGGQILLSGVTTELVRPHLPAQLTLHDLGEHRLKDLTQPEHIYQLSQAGLESEFLPIQTQDIIPNNLPSQLTSFVGREKEVAGIKSLLESSRLVTLTGSGGTGKTRLAQEVGSRLLEQYSNGVWVVELAPLSDPAQIIPAMAQVFGLQELPAGASLANLINDYLREKELLLVLDNCEHLIETCAYLANDLLRQCPKLKILASSREALGIAGEMSYRVPSMAASESSQLFIDRARAANSNFNPFGANAAAIDKICSRLDGIPLAIELAAARVRSLSPEQIADRLDDRFRLLVGGSRTALPRQQTLRALIDWSYDLLSSQEKDLLQFASVFMGGWTLEALETVADEPDTLDLLEHLVNKSLVIAEERESEMRYFLLETIRQYARDKLFESQRAQLARDRHFSYYTQLSEKLWEVFRSSDVLPMVKRTQEELENFRAALEWGLENHPEENLRLAANFCVIASIRSNMAEGVAFARKAVERARALPPVEAEANLSRQKLMAKALFTQGMIGLGVGEIPLVLQALREAIAISRTTGDKQILGYSLEMYFTATTFMPSLTDGPDAALEGYRIFTQEITDDRFGAGMAYLNMARIASSHGDHAEKQRYFERVKEMARSMPRSYQVGMFFMGMGLDEHMRGNYQTAKKVFLEGLEIFDRIQNFNFSVVLKSELGHIERKTGNFAQAKAIYNETLRGWRELGNRAAIAHQLECFGFLAIAAQELQRAAKLFGAAEALRETTRTPMIDREQIEYDQQVAELRVTMSKEEFAACWREGRATSMEQAIQFALGEEILN